MDVQEFRNPLTWKDVDLVISMTIAFIVVGTVLFLISNNIEVIWIVAILTSVEIVAFLLPELLTKPSMIRMDQEAFSIRTRFGRTLSYSYENISFIKLGGGQSHGIRYGVFQTTSQNYGSYFVKYEIAEALLRKCQENVSYMPRIELEP